MTEDDIEAIKRNLSTERIIKRAASDWSDQSSGDKVGRCTHPEHGHTSDNSNAGNLVVFDDGNWYCHSHATGGDVIDWIAIEEGYTTCQGGSVSGDAFVEVLKEAADRAGVELSSKPTPENYEEAVEMDSLTEEEKASYALDAALDILHDNLSKVVGQTTVRGLINNNRPFGDEVIDKLRVGYLDGEVYGELLRTLSEEALEDIGLKREDGGQHGTGRIIYPYYDSGRPVFWVGRRTDNSEMEAKYLKPHKASTVFDEPLFKYRPPQRDPEQAVWITEGIQDAIALAEHEGKWAVSPVCKNPSGHQKSQLIDVAQQEGRAVIAFDADEAGQGGAVEVAEDLMSAGVDVEIAPFPDDTDPCDFFMEERDFSEIEPVHAAERIVEVKGESDRVLRELLDTVEPDTPRSERLVDTLSECTPVRKEVLRDLLQEERGVEQQHGWREPERCVKVTGADPEWTFVYPDGTEITMESLAGRRAASKFADRFAAKFNFVPDISPSDFRERVNEWMNGGIETREVHPLSDEGQALHEVQKQLSRASVVEDFDDVASVGKDPAVLPDGGSIIYVPSETVGDWMEDMDVSLRQVSEYVSPIRVGDTTRKRVGGSRVYFWRFDVEKVRDNGYTIPEPKGVPDMGDEDEVEL